jgi:hypothetical protein
MIGISIYPWMMALIFFPFEDQDGDTSMHGNSLVKGFNTTSSILHESKREEMRRHSLAINLIVNSLSNEEYAPKWDSDCDALSSSSKSDY